MVVAVAATESVTEEADILFVSCNQKKTMKIGKQILVEILERERKAGWGARWSRWRFGVGVYVCGGGNLRR